MSLNRLLEISRNSLSAYQQALNVTSHNISNAQNANYSRQKVVLSSDNTGANIIGNYFGNGVKLEDVQRVKNNIIENNVRQTTQNNAYASKQSSIMQSVQSLLSEPSDLGLSSLMNKFFNSWNQLSTNPTSDPLRANVVQSALTMATKFTSIQEGINQIKADLKTEAQSDVSTINSLTKQINTVNKQIASCEGTNASPNDLLDARDELVLQLSKLANISVSTDDHNLVSISIGGVFAVDRAFQNEFQVSEQNGKLVVVAKGDTEALALTGGELGGVVNSYSTNAVKVQNDFQSIAQAIFDKTNQLHSAGYTLHNPPFTAVNFFESISGSILTVNKNILSDNRFIATSSDGNSGNNEISTAISNIQNQRDLNNYSIGEKYGSVISSIASEITTSEQNAESYKLALDQLQQQKDSTSGVSIDEEMVNIISFQRSYTASAKLIKVADEMIQTILNMV